MVEREEICEYLREHHTGRKNAIHGKELHQIFKIDARNFRRKINRLRREGEPICSDHTGYYYAENERDIRITTSRMDAMAVKVEQASNGMKLQNCSQTIVLEITIRVKEVGTNAK